MLKTVLTLCLVCSGLASETMAQIDARMLRQPDVSQNHIAFVYAGDIWIVAKSGGTAQRLTSAAGEESLPRFSPDGSQLAFGASYDGNPDIYVIPVVGGLPTRVTYHPSGDRILDWFPDGRSLLFASGREAGRQRFNQFFTVGRDGGLPERLPVPYGEFGAISPDGTWLAYTTRSRDYRTWKRYRGGMASDIWLFNLQDHSARIVAESPATDGQPMWHGRKLYFLSDRGSDQRFNIWVHELDSGKTRQVTHFPDLDIHFPSIGPSEIVFEAGGRLYLLQLKNEKYQEVKVGVVTDRSTLRPRIEKVGTDVLAAAISPSGNEVLFEARGEIFSVPAEHGIVRNLTRSSGAADRFPTWSPDGKKIAYWSDRSGEYELILREVEGLAPEKSVTSLGPGFRYRPRWSPDGKRLVFVDQDVVVRILDLESGSVEEIDRGQWVSHQVLSGFTFSWSRDSRWIAYSRTKGDDVTNAVFLYDTREKRLHQVTAGAYSDSSPVFDPDGKYLYYLSNRTLTPLYTDLGNSWVYPNTTSIVALSLRRDVKSPLHPQEASGKSEIPTSREENSKEGPQTSAAKDSPSSEAVGIDLKGLERRLVVLPAEAGNYGALAAVSGRVIYLRQPRSGSPEESKSQLIYFDLKERKEHVIVTDVSYVQLSSDGQKLLVRQKQRFGILDVKPGQKIETPLRTSELETTVDPRAEWRQIFHDAWRFERDFFYDPNLHGVDWVRERERYERLLEDAVTRWDVSFVLGELIGELNASHTYVRGGDEDPAERRSVGLLGVDWTLEEGAYRIKRIVRGPDWAQLRAPVDQPGMDVSEGDFVLAVNGVPLEPSVSPWAGFQGLGGETVELTVGDTPQLEGARRILVETLRDDSQLRHLEWVENNRVRVDERSGGRIGYVYVSDTGTDGQTALVRQFAAQFQKPGLIIDERFNSGGQIPDRFIELLNRPAMSWWAVRDGRLVQWPPMAHFGPKAMLINGWSGSGGDLFPFYFREAGLGPLIGTRTWGGLIGISGSPSLVDGGQVTVPTIRMLDTKGKWFAEGYGVEPDIEVLDDPSVMSRGDDPLELRIVDEVLKLLERGDQKPSLPPYEDRSLTGSAGRARSR